ncbi:hypothetical protein F0562_010729 [Nyssa sinensis]|uniref:Uncharacterized protein n=1 Tax=Nyssa sinensis TaxID=561372 RepID=A0A5J5A2L2_9ASTE|nr:hypothetical protein F0562_010729 [Nyssa sinensis]
MARTNKYASLNFNDIYEKKNINPNNKRPSSSSSLPSASSSLTNSSKTIISNSRIHGNMLVLSRPSPKSIPQPSAFLSPPPLPQPPAIPDQTRFESDSISLRPLGRTGSGPSISLIPSTSPKPDKELPPSPKLDRFVPPHLRPGFVGREERLVPEFQKQPGVRSREFGVHGQGHFGSPNRHGEDGRPKSGGGYERMRMVGDSDLMEMNRPASSGSRPSSSG